MASGRKHCVVAYATRDEQWLWELDLPDHATVGDALTEARAKANRDDVPWDSSPLGIFGQPCQRTDVPVDGDRIEIYRALAADPRARRRQQVQSERRKSRNRPR